MPIIVAFLIDRGAVAPAETFSNFKMMAFTGLFQVQ